MTTSTTTLAAQTPAFNLDSLLEGTLDDLADLPEFKVPPPGVYRAITTITQKEVNNHPCFEFKGVIKEILELTNPNDTANPPPAVDSTFQVLYMMDNEMGVGKFKKVMSGFAEKFGSMRLKDLVAVAQGCECFVITKLKLNKEKTEQYCDIVELKVV